jgi:pimeloyl-ACP methyl ester carboxylesterase
MKHPSGLAVHEHVPSESRIGDPVVVLVHGTLDRSTSFARVVRRLGDLHTVVYDRRGYHRSRDAVPLPTSIEGQIDDLLRVIDGRPAVVVGHSYGGTICIGAALRHDPSNSIVSLAAYEPPLPWLSIWVRDGTPRRERLREDPDFEAERFFRRVVGDGAWDRLSETARAERRADGPALVAELNAIRVTNAPFDVSTMSIPALFGRGGQSLPHHREGVAWLVEHTPDAELFEIPGARHGAHLSHPDRFAEFVRRAVERAGEVSVTTSGGTQLG